ncbi:hypothetical protein JCM10207_002599 [Rhodosporidiobolus poonsookiae]
MIGFAILFVFQAPLGCIPVVRLRWFFIIKAWITGIGFFALFVWAMVVTKGKGFLFQGNFDDSLTPYGSRAWACIATLNAITGLYSTVSIWSQALAVPITGTIPIAVAICCAEAAKQKYGVTIYDPASLCAVFDSRAAQFFSAFCCANSISFATDITSIFPRYLTIFRCSVLAGILCWATNPWHIVTDAPSFVSFLGAYPVFLAPVATILATDFFVVRRGKVDVRQLYEPKGIYSYFYGVNFRAIAAWIFAFAPNLPSFAHAVMPSNPNPQPYTYMFSWYFSTATSFFWYLLINKLFPPHSSFVDEAVYEVYSLEYPETASASGGGEKVDEDKLYAAGIVPV